MSWLHMYIKHMPIITESSYHTPFYLLNAHALTMLPAIFRSIKDVHYTRKRMFTVDDDFIDLDWSCTGSSQVVIILHGLEGHTKRAYMRGMVRACNRAKWDAVAVNMRGCSGEPNNQPRSYHNGSSDDLDSVIRHVAALPYQKIMLIGFSLGGNVVLKYLGEGQWKYPSALTAAAAISVPCHLESCAHKLSIKENRIYLNRFLKMLHKKIIVKKAFFPELFNDNGFKSIHSFKDFDDRYTAPLHGFTNAEDYWKKASSLQYLSSITLPTLMISAADDPFLTPLCFPRDIAERHCALTLEITRHGGHLGFGGPCRNGEYWHERRTVEFLKENNN